MTRPADNSVLRYFRDCGAIAEGSARPPDSVPQYGNYLATIKRDDWLGDVLQRVPQTSSFFCDANVLTDPALNQRLSPRAVVISEVEKEVDKFCQSKLEEARSRLGPLLGADGRLSGSVRRFDRASTAGVEHAAMHYINLLHRRRTALDRAYAAFADQHGRPPSGREKGEITSRLPSLRTRNVSKGFAQGSFADDALPVLAVLHALVSNTDTFVISADNDVFDQFYKLTSMLRDDYVAARFAEEFHRRPERFPPRIYLSDYPDLDELVSDKSESFVVSRPANLDGFLPLGDETRAICVLRPRPDGAEFIQWVCTRGLLAFLRAKSRHKGLNTPHFGGLNCYAVLRPTAPPTLPNGHYAFFLRDRLVVDKPEIDLRLSAADHYRVLCDFEAPRVEPAPPPISPWGRWEAQLESGPALDLHGTKHRLEFGKTFREVSAQFGVRRSHVEAALTSKSSRFRLWATSSAAGVLLCLRTVRPGPNGFSLLVEGQVGAGTILATFAWRLPHAEVALASDEPDEALRALARRFGMDFKDPNEPATSTKFVEHVHVYDTDLDPRLTVRWLGPEHAGALTHQILEGAGEHEYHVRLFFVLNTREYVKTLRRHGIKAQLPLRASMHAF